MHSPNCDQEGRTMVEHWTRICKIMRLNTATDAERGNMMLHNASKLQP